MSKLNLFEEWKEKIFLKEQLEDVSRAKLAEAQEGFLNKGEKWIDYTPLSQEKVLQLLSTKHKQLSDIELNDRKNKGAPAKNKTNIWSSFFRKQKETTKEGTPQLAKHREMTHKK